ncbi:MAG: hypothetical protein GX224_06750 [Thermoplasmatales archaeon]|nr:hypothetical protein [Thermoplasmatales archaeon]
MNPRRKRAVTNGLIVGSVLGLALSGVFYLAMHNPSVWIFAPMAAVIGAAQGYMARDSE